jgi:hypothetical protein
MPKDRQYNGKKEMDKKTKNQATSFLLKIGRKLSRRVSSSCSICGTRCVTLLLLQTRSKKAVASIHKNHYSPPCVVISIPLALPRNSSLTFDRKQMSLRITFYRKDYDIVDILFSAYDAFLE